MSKFDISQFETVDTAALELKKPNGDELLVDGKKVIINLYGPGSKEYINAKYKFENATQARSIAMIRGKISKNIAEESAQLQAERLAGCTESIENFPIDGGALALYSNPKLSYITDQVIKFLDDTENFMPSLPTK